MLGSVFFGSSFPPRSFSNRKKCGSLRANARCVWVPPLRGFVLMCGLPRAYALGYPMPPLRGLLRCTTGSLRDPVRCVTRSLRRLLELFCLGQCPGDSFEYVGVPQNGSLATNTSAGI
jgi:hypothetical protein